MTESYLLRRFSKLTGNFSKYMEQNGRDLKHFPILLFIGESALVGTMVSILMLSLLTIRKQQVRFTLLTNKTHDLKICKE